jgi:hypothetical protein
MTRLHNVIKSVKPNGIHINENLAGAQEEIEMGNDGQLQWANINGNSCQFTMGWAESSSNGALTNAFLATNYGSRPWGSTVAYAESHDEERMGYKNNTYGNTNIKGNKANSVKRLGSLAAQMLMTPGPKMIWQFGELGADQTTKNSSGNDTSPKTVIWDRLNDEDYNGLMETYKALCNMRKDNADVFAEDAEFTATGIGGAMTSNRILRATKGNKEIMLFMNPNTGGTSKAVSGTSTVLNANNCQLLCATPGVTPTLSGTGTTVSVSLPAHSFAIFATTDVAGVDNISVNSRAQVSVSKGEIVINGDYNNVEVYNLAGAKQHSLRVAPGLYIVNVDGNATKVIVK